MEVSALSIGEIRTGLASGRAKTEAVGAIGSTSRLGARLALAFSAEGGERSSPADSFGKLGLSSLGGERSVSKGGVER